MAGDAQPLLHLGLDGFGGVVNQEEGFPFGSEAPLVLSFTASVLRGVPTGSPGWCFVPSGGTRGLIDVLRVAQGGNGVGPGTGWGRPDLALGGRGFRRCLGPDGGI